ncbi:MAG: molybdopterin-synthase adenylyltransferase MoeB [Acidobacteria bacterium]|nr:molybdopterin-synthase adenylyltransferase MoeB [Acidobacteriota bacterium]
MKILIPTPLRNFAGGKSEFTTSAATVQAGLEELVAEYPQLKNNLFNAEGKLRSFVNVYVNDDDVRDLSDGLNSKPKEDDEISIIPSIAGGADVTLSNEEIARYSRHLILPEVGMEGQKKLKAAKVLCVGTGGLGAPMAMYLAAAGVGTIGLIDFDVVDESNLQRQIIHSQSTVGMLKVDSAEQMLKGLNKNTNIVKFNTMLTSANALEIFKDFDIIADGTDNFQTRYLVNDACVLSGKPNVYASIFRFEGQASIFGAEAGPCYRCLYPEPPPPGLVPSCAEGGVLGILPGLLGIIQATEVIKLILGIGDPLIGRLLLVDSLGMSFRTLKLRKNPNCPMCGTHEIKQLIDYDQFCGVPKPTEVGPLEVSSHGNVAAAAEFDGIPQVTVEELQARMKKGDVFVLDVREPHEAQIATLGAPLIPVGTLAQRIDEVASHKNEDIFVHCKLGGRSQQAAQILKAAGFQHVYNVQGGIQAWAERIDPTMPKY